MQRVLISDKLSQKGVEILQQAQGIEATVSTGLSEEELIKEIGSYHGLIVRSATKVTARVIEAAESLQVIARAGVGVDNVDIPAASKRGIVVMNAPAGNTIATAEHSMAMIMSLARHIPQANQSMKTGKWEKKLFMGTEVTGKTLGVIGLGRIGKEVAHRANGVRMEVIGYDPYMPKDKLRHLEMEIVDFDELLRRSDYITIHTPLNDQTRHIIHEGNLAQLKQGVRLVNCARGGLYHEEALLKGLESGRIAGVALDVFTQEPPEGIAVVDHPSCITTPHLGASTDEAQVSVAVETAEEVRDFLQSGVARNSLNFPTMDPHDMPLLAPWFRLCEALGLLLAQYLKASLPRTVTLRFQGDFATGNLDSLRPGFLRGLLHPLLGESTNYVNAPLYAKEHGLSLHLEHEKETFEEYRQRVRIETSGEISWLVEGSVLNGIPHVISLQETALEFPLQGVVLLVENRDVPNMVGAMGGFIGSRGVNIGRLELSRQDPKETALTAIALDTSLSEEDLAQFRRQEGIISAFQVDFGKG